MTRLPLVWRVFVSTSLVTTGLFVLIAWLVQNHLLRTTASMLDEELQASFGAYEAVWNTRAESLASVSRVISGMPDVRAAFSTGDTATIRDTASEVWARFSPANAVFFVTDPPGRVIASLGGTEPPPSIDAVAAVASRFPRQASGFWFIRERLHQVVVTPVYVDSARGSALINVLVAAFPVDRSVLERLKTAAGSDLSIEVGGRVVASTVDRQDDWATLAKPLMDLNGRTIGELRFMRSRGSVTTRLSELRWQIAATWVVAILFALMITFVAARHLLKPIRQLDAGAREIRRGNYDYRVPLSGPDEMGRLGEAFNAMSQSIQESRAELIRQERISTLGRIAGTVVHDLRNPLAAIYSGAEMLVDSDGMMPASYTQRIASNIYRASRQVLSLLDDLMGLARGSAPASEICRIAEIVEDAWAANEVEAERAGITFTLTADPAAEAPVARARVERVFANLFANAIEAMPKGGRVEARVQRDGDRVIVTVADNGPGIPAAIRTSLFQPFTTAGKSNGLGLGLALSRQTMLDHGGNLTLEPSEVGATFRVSLPAAARRAAA